MVDGKKPHDEPHDEPKEKGYFYFVDSTRYETDQPKLTGAMIKAKVPNCPAGYSLVLEGHGNDPDQVIADETSVSLEKDKGPRRFFLQPPATFGA